MTGRYRFNLESALAVKRADAIKASLDRDGIAYSTSFDGRWCLISATGTPKKRRIPTVTKRYTAPPILTQAQCEKRLKEIVAAANAYRAGLQRNMQQNWHEVQRSRWYSHEGFVGRRKRNKAIGEAIGIIIARHRTKRPWHYSKADYEILDAACGHRVCRKSHLPARYSDLTEYIVRSEAHGCFDKRKASETEELEVDTSRPVQRFVELKADVEHWREMVRLASERENSSLQRKNMEVLAA